MSTIRSSVARRPTALHGGHSLWTIARRGTLYVGIWDDDEDVLACEDRANHRRRGSDYYQISVADVMTRILQDRPRRRVKKGRGRRACDRASSGTADHTRRLGPPGRGLGLSGCSHLSRELSSYSKCLEIGVRNASLEDPSSRELVDRQPYKVSSP